jgi:hypothetical protein
MSRCWAVTQTKLVIPEVDAKAFTTGAILIASGLVPKTLNIRIAIYNPNYFKDHRHMKKHNYMGNWNKLSGYMA